MMYCEFIDGTGCKDNEHNYKVYKNLEIMYMNSNMSKQEIYEYGKKLVDNSKTEEEIRFEKDMKSQMDELKKQIKENREFAKMYEEEAKHFKQNGYDDLAKTNKSWAKWRREENRELRRKIDGIKFVMGW